MEIRHIVAVLGDWATGSGPLYRQLEAALRRAIVDRDLPSGTRLPAEREMARHLAVSRTTTTAAYQLLKQEGWLESRAGSVTRVRAGIPGLQADWSSSGNSNWYLHADFHSHLPGEPRIIDLTASGFRGFIDLPPDALRLRGAELARVVAETDGYAPFGLPRLREAIARRLTAQRLPTVADQILITGGAQQAINVAATLYVKPGAAAVLENPTYFGAIDAFQAAAARMIGLPIDGDGIDPQRFADVLRQRRVSLAYLILSFNNPTGALTPDPARSELARLIQFHGVPTIDDTTFANQIAEIVPPPPLAAYADVDHVLTVGTLSTIFGGGLRVGWIRGAPPVIARLARLKLVADLGTSVPSQLLATSLLDHADTVDGTRRGLLAARRAVLVSALAHYLPEWKFEVPKGGVFIWARIPFGDSSELAQVALRTGVRITPGWPMSVDRSHTDFVRLPVIEEATVEKGIRLLARAWARYSEIASSRHRLASAPVTPNQ